MVWPKAELREVTIDGIAFSGRCPRAYLAKLGALIESPAFYPGLKGRDHLAYLARVRSRCSDALIGGALARVGLDADSRKPVRKYSTGMKQRLGIAMAILHKPRLLVLDEPTNGLDPAAIVAMRELIRQLAEGGTAVLVSSHLLSEIERVCDRVVFVKAGRVARDQKIQDDKRTSECSFGAITPRQHWVLTKEDFVLEIQPSENGLMCTLWHRESAKSGPCSCAMVSIFWNSLR